LKKKKKTHQYMDPKLMDLQEGMVIKGV